MLPAVLTSCWGVPALHKTIRLFFSKRDRCKYISHLDITRVFSRAIARAGVPVWFTEGFSPRAYMTFPLPLSLGYQSCCESLDMRLVDEQYPLEQVAVALNKTLPDGIRILSVGLPQQPPAAIALADYQIDIESDDPAALAAQVDSLLAEPAIPVIKKTKKGDRELDIKPHCTLLQSVSVQGYLQLTLRLAAGTELNISPALFLEALAARAGAPAYCRIERQAILTADGDSWN